MNTRMRWLLVIAISVVALGSASTLGVLALLEYEARGNAPSVVATASPGEWATGDRIVFRNSASGRGYGHVASVPMSDASGERAILDVACDRVDASATEFVCLRSERGIAAAYTATLYANDAHPLAQWPLPGIPSRTRLSPDSSLVATTAFVTGHTYATVGFSTETVIRTRTGISLGNLEDFALILDGSPTAPVDRNFWGVTFVDDTTFYATAQTDNRTYLVRGDLAAKSLTAVAEDVECPSLSPDGERIAFKKVTAGAGPTSHWTAAILDLGSREVTLLPEPRSVDDQITWLDDHTVLYGMPRPDDPGDYDIWSLPADGSGAPTLFIEHAWSPAVVHR